MYRIINEAAQKYEGVIPADRYHQPYMPESELRQEMKRMTFYGWEDNSILAGVMGLERVKDVSLIRHVYIANKYQRQGVGSKLLIFAVGKYTGKRLLVGTWADASWALDFYKKHGFKLCAEKEKLLRTYWDIPHRQIETSVVLELVR